MNVDERNRGSVLVVIVAVVSIVAVGALGWRVYTLNKDNNRLKGELVTKESPKDSPKQQSSEANTSASPIVSAESKDFSIKVLDRKYDPNVYRTLFLVELTNTGDQRQDITSADFSLRTKTGEVLSPVGTMNALFSEPDLKQVTLEANGTTKKVMSFDTTIEDADVLLFRSSIGNELSISLR